MSETLNLLRDLIDSALKAGADAADALLVEGISSSVSVRLGEIEEVERAEGADVGLRVFVGKHQAIVSTSDCRPPALAALVERAVPMARATPEDPWCGLADENRLAISGTENLDLFDEAELPAEKMEALAREAEEAARAVDGVTNSEGAAAGWSKSKIALATSSGFAGSYRSSSFSLSASVLAGEGTGMERDYDYSSTRYYSDLMTPEEVGRSAGERAVRRLGARAAKTASVPIVFDTRVSNSLLGHFSSAINGRAIARGTSFLKDKMGEAVFGKGIVVRDDPHRRRGLRSKPFDGEGVATAPLAVVDDGVLASWFLDSASARQLGLETTGHARRGTSGPPSPGSTNLFMEAGDDAPEAMIAALEEGFYVTELIGMGVNGVTGDYSRGAAGFWIEMGELAYPVREVTIAGNLKDMFRALTPASDLEFRYGTNAPTVLIEGMTVAGA